jgi:hypothetical protein
MATTVADTSTSSPFSSTTFNSNGEPHYIACLNALTTVPEADYRNLLVRLCIRSRMPNTNGGASATLFAWLIWQPQPNGVAFSMMNMGELFSIPSGRAIPQATSPGSMIISSAKIPLRPGDETTTEIVCVPGHWIGTYPVAPRTDVYVAGAGAYDIANVQNGSIELWMASSEPAITFLVDVTTTVQYPAV